MRSLALRTCACGSSTRYSECSGSDKLAITFVTPDSIQVLQAIGELVLEEQDVFKVILASREPNLDLLSSSVITGKHPTLNHEIYTQLSCPQGLPSTQSFGDRPSQVYRHLLRQQWTPQVLLHITEEVANRGKYILSDSFNFGEDRHVVFRKHDGTVVSFNNIEANPTSVISMGRSVLLHQFTVPDLTETAQFAAQCASGYPD